MTRDGGPAFPRDSYKDREAGLIVRQEGMSLRDYMAAAALTGLVAHDTLSAELAAMEAYEHADAMLKAREEAPHD